MKIRFESDRDEKLFLNMCEIITYVLKENQKFKDRK